MENKNNNVLVIILLIVVVCLTGFIVYDKVSSNKNDSNPTENNGNNTNQNNQDNNVKETSNSFELFKNNLIKERKEKYDTSKDNYIVDSKSEKDYTISLLANGDLKLTVNNKSNKDKVIAKNVLLYEITYVGNGGMKSVYFVKEDGTVSSYFVDNYVTNGKDEAVNNNIGNFKDVIAIIPGSVDFENDPSGGMTPNFIDINGNILSLNY